MHLHLRRFTVILVAVAFGSTCADSAVASPFGTQSPLASLLGDLNTAERPAMAAGEEASLVVWREDMDITQRSLVSTWHVAGRFVDGAGVPVGDAFVIADVGQEPSRPDVTYNAAQEEFLVVWRAAAGGGMVFAQRVAAAGGLVGTAVPVRSTGKDTSQVARVAWASDVDQYLVVWDQDQDQVTGRGGCCSENEDVLGLRLRGEDATPFPVEAPLRLSDGVFEEDYPDVAYDASAGTWLVAFEGELVEQGVLRGEDDDELLGTTVNPEDEVAGPRVLSDTGHAVSRPSVVANTKSGGFVVAWSMQGLSRQSFNGDVVARRFDADGDGVGDEVAVSPTDDAAFGSTPGIAYDENADEYLIVWWHELTGSRGFVPIDQVFGRRYSNELAPLEDAHAISVLGEPDLRGAGTFSAARQPVAAYVSSTCTFMAAYEVYSGNANIASRGFDAPDCAKAQEEPKPILSNRDSTVRGTETVTGTSAASLVAARCKSRRVFSIRLVSRRSRRYKSATVTVNGKAVKRLKGGGGEATVDLEGLPAGTFSVKLVAKLADGRTLRYTRKYKTCNRKLKASNRLHTKKAV